MEKLSKPLFARVVADRGRILEFWSLEVVEHIRAVGFIRRRLDVRKFKK